MKPKFIETAYTKKSKRGRNIKFGLYECECGKQFITREDAVKYGNTQSCGCLKSKLLTERNMKHGKSYSKLYKKFIQMKTRCYNPNYFEYKYYGGKGVTVEWNNFEDFEKWALSNGYEEGLTIERVNPNGPYSSDNCEFITLEENIRRSSTIYEYTGISPEGEKVVFHNASEFCKGREFTPTGISSVCNGKQSTHRGWTFKKKRRIDNDI